MPIFGAHLSIAGGLFKAAEAAVALDCGTVQLFTKNANQWVARPLADDDIRAFKNAVKAAKLKFVTAHDSYLINVAAPDDELFRKSVAALTDELERAEALGLSYLVSHPGAHTGSGEEAGIARVVAGLNEVHARCSGFKAKILLETTAGSGTTLGGRFEQLAAMLERVKDPARLGICLDTCHVFAAGYPLAAAADYAATFAAFDDLIGLSRLKLFHVNDSEKPLGSRVDRHAGLGLGQIGLEAFRRLVTDPRFANRPMILETPKEDDDGNEMDPVNLGVLRRFAAEAAGDAPARAG
jgi:deoxyribonuclease-4